MNKEIQPQEMAKDLRVQICKVVRLNLHSKYKVLFSCVITMHLAYAIDSL